MGNRRSKNHKAKAKPKALNKHQAWGKKSSDENATKSESAFEKFFFSLICFQWFCNKRGRSDLDDEDDITMSGVAWHQSPPSQDPMLERVPARARVCGDRIPTRRGGVRPSFAVPYNQPASFEGAETNSSSPAPIASNDAVQSNLIQAFEAAGVRQSNRSPEEFGRVFSPLPGSVMETDCPVSNLFITGAQAASFPVRDSSMVRYGQLPPLRHSVGASSPLSTTLNAATDPTVPLSVTSPSGISAISGSGQSTELEQDDEFDFDEVIALPSDGISSPEPVNSDKLQKMNEKERDQFKQRVDEQTKKRLAAKKGGEKAEDLPGSDIPSLEEFVKQEEQKRKKDMKREKAEHKKDRKQQKKEKKKQKKLEKKIAKMDKKKLMQKQKEEIKAEKAEKRAAKAERAATEGETKRRSRLATRLHEMIKDSNKLKGDNLEKEQRKLEKKQRKREARARRKMREIARLELDVKILWTRMERKDKKITQLSVRRDRLNRPGDSTLAEFKLDFRIGDYKRRFNNIKDVIIQLKRIIYRKQMKVKKLAPHLLIEAAKKPQNLENDDLSLESISTLDFEDDCSIAGDIDAAGPDSDSDSDSDDSDVLDIIDLEDCSDSDSESSSDEEADDEEPDDDDDDEDYCAYDENEDEDEQIAKLFMNFCYRPTCDDEEEAERDQPREKDSSNVQEILRKAQESLKRMDECRATQKERRDRVVGFSKKDKPSYSDGGKELANDKSAVRKGNYF